MLYDDAEQLEVRHVISLANYDADVYGGGERIPEGELWIKRNCIRLIRRPQQEKTVSDTKPFYLFSDNCSEKEDFYHAILQSQDRGTEAPRSPPHPLKFDTPDLVRLVQQLHASEENLHTRWLNALIGRLFLALYKTDQVEQFIWKKITKKIARVPKPALISKISLQKVDMGNLPPFITNPRLRELTVDGDMTVEADVNYKGNFRVEISAIARIELGSRFKAREVTLVLATTLKKLEGHVLLRVKPPPSNRLWITFESAPKMELSLEPIVSSRQITYGVILRAIESRLREVVSETLVLPNWDDIPFKDTESNPFRGGIWTNDAKREHTVDQLDELAGEELPLGDKDYDSGPDSDTETAHTPASNEGPKLASATTFLSLDSVDTPLTPSSPALSVRSNIKPKAMRSASFASASAPVVNVDASNVSATRSEVRQRKQDAAATMKTISMSQPTSPADTPVGSPEQPSHMQGVVEARRRTSPAGFDTSREQRDDDDGKSSIADQSSAKLYLSPDSVDSQTSMSSLAQNAKNKHGVSVSLPRNTFGSTEKRQTVTQSLNSAAATAKKWFAAKQGGDGPSSPYLKSGAASPRLPAGPPDDSPPEDNSKIAHPSLSFPSSSGTEITAPLGSPANPIGRGQPITEQSAKRNNSGWSVPTVATLGGLANLAKATKRKPAPGKAQSASLESHSSLEEQAPPLPARTPKTSSSAAPSASASTSQYSTSRPTHSRQTSVGTAAMGVRRKSSAMPPPAPGTAAPGRRQRRSATESTGSVDLTHRASTSAGSEAEGLFVIEAPVEGTVPSSPGPAKLERLDSEESVSVSEKGAEKEDDGEGMVFQVDVEHDGGDGDGDALRR
jgi:hypothetical protein